MGTNQSNLEATSNEGLGINNSARLMREESYSNTFTGLLGSCS